MVLHAAACLSQRYDWRKDGSLKTTAFSASNRLFFEELGLKKKSRNSQDKSAEAVEKRGYVAGCGEKQMGKNKSSETTCDER